MTFDDLKSVYLDNKDLLHYSANNIQSSNHFITSIGELFNPTRTVEDVLETDLHVQWLVSRVDALLFGGDSYLEGECRGFVTACFMKYSPFLFISFSGKF